MFWVVQMFAYSILLKVTVIYFKVAFLDFYFKVRDVYGKHMGKICSV